MTPAELKTLRESLGLMPSDVAAIGRVRRRTAEYWEAGRMAVKSDVAAFLLDLDRAFNLQAARSVELARQTAKKHGKPDSVELTRYREHADLVAAHPEFVDLPTSCHAAMLARVRAALSAAGFIVSIKYREDDM